ncbi:MAG: YdcF family protein [Proteobacteria bacterium]|nr:YdcF family protein [Pseudomonadota bacterium]
MFLYIIGWFIVNIDITLAILISLGMVLLFKQKAMGKWIVAICFALYFLIGQTTILNYPTLYLENTYQKPNLEETEFEGIILLGGNYSIQLTTPEKPVFNLAASRLFEGILLAKQYPDKKIIFTGTAMEAAITKDYFLKAGIKEEQFIIDSMAKNTKNNASGVKDLLKEDAQKPMLLVTSAFHMKRSVLLFQKEGINVIPYPVDYHTRAIEENGMLSYIKNIRLNKDGFLIWYATAKEFLGLWNEF